MAHPPSKRRRLHGSPSQEKARWKHLKASSNVPSRVEGDEASDAAAGSYVDAEFQAVVPRQDTALSVLESALSEVPAVSASVSIGLDGSSVASAVTSVVGGVTSILDPSSSAAALSTSSSVVPSSIAASSTQDVSGSSATTSTGDASLSSTSTSVESTSSTSTSSSTSVTTSSTTNLPVLTTSSSSLRNSTSATSTSSSTVTSTARLSSSSSSIARSTSLQSSSTQDPIALTSTAFLATLSNGMVSTFTRASQAYVTTVDGNAFTVPALQTVTSYAYVPGGGGSGSTPTAGAAPSQTSATLVSDSSNNGNSSPPAGAIAGGVVGGAAGLAVVLLIAMMAVRWYRRNGQSTHRALPPASSDAYNGDGIDGDQPHRPGMAERAGTMPFAVTGLMRNQSQSAHTSSEPSERGFTRVSGRKLPSAFSGGMSSRSPPPSMPLTENPGADRESNGSWYQDNYGYGYYGGEGESPPAGTYPEHMTMSPGPQRTPVVHSGGPYTMSPASSAGPASPQYPGFLGHNSRFTEEM